MGTTPRLKFYLTFGELSIILPGLYGAFHNKSFTCHDAKEKVTGFRQGHLLQMSNLGIIVPATGKSRKHIFRQERTQWKFTADSYLLLKKYMAEKNEEGINT